MVPLYRMDTAEPLYLLTWVKIFTQGLDVLLKCFKAHRRDAAKGTRALTLECFLYGDLARGREFVELLAQVARRGARLLLDVGELGRLGTDEQRHHRQSQLTVQQWI